VQAFDRHDGRTHGQTDVDSKVRSNEVRCAQKPLSINVQYYNVRVLVFMFEFQHTYLLTYFLTVFLEITFLNRVQLLLQERWIRTLRAFLILTASGQLTTKVSAESFRQTEASGGH